MKTNAILATVALSLICGWSFSSQAKTPSVVQYQSAVLSKASLISYYKFDGNTASDSFGTNNGSLQGTANYTNGIRGGADVALNLDGGGWDNLGSVSPFDFTNGNGTVELWLQAGWTNTPSIYPCIFANRDGGGTRYSIHMSPAKTQIAFWNGTNAQYVSLPAYADTNWHRLAVEFNSGNWTVIWDGQSLATNALPLGSIGHPVALGNGFAGDTEQWIGKLDEVKFYNAAGLSETRLISYYEFDDSTANDDVWINNGALQGSAYYNTGVGGGADASIGMAANGWDNLGSVPAFDFSSGSGTVELWLQAAWTTAPAYYPCIFADRDGGGTRYSIHMSPDKSQIAFWNGTNAQYVSLPSLAGLSWHHMAVVFNAGNWTVTWDGQSVVTNALALGSVGHTNFLGNGFSGDTEEWYGFLDEVAFYSAALNLGGIQAHYEAYFSGVLPVILAQPQGGSWLVGQSNQVAISVNAIQQPHYQWYKNNSLLSGATNSILSWTSLALANAGTYTCVVTNYGGSVTSSPAVVWVSPNTPAGDYQSAVLSETSLISYYKFDDSTANDDVGTNNGALHGTANYSAGFRNGADLALNLDGTNGWDNLGVVPAFDFTNGLGTVELLVLANTNTIASGNYPCILADGDGSGRDYSVHLNPGAGYLLIGPANIYAALPTTLDTNWHHLALIFTNSTVAVVWDGQALNWWDGHVGSHPFTLGAEGYGHTVQLGDWTGGASPWGGNLDEVAFYNKALPVSDIQAHYQAGNFPVIITQPQGGNWLVGQSRQLNIAVNALQQPHYQWYQGNSFLPGATNGVLSWVSLALTNAGTYTCVVTNYGGSVTSSPAVLTVSNLSAAVSNYRAKVQAEASLISYYQFDDGTANDDYGTNNGVLHETANYANGIGGGPDLALSLDGTNGWDNLGVVPAFDFSGGKGTVELWVRANASTIAASGSYPCILANGDGGGRDYSVHLATPGNYLQIGPTNIYAALPATLDTNWHHLALIWTNSTLVVVWDGQALNWSDGQVGSHPFTLGAQGYGHTVQLGDWTGGAAPWGGNLDEVAFYSNALPVSSIQTHFTTFESCFPPVIVEQPRGGAGVFGEGFNIFAKVSGSGLNYQWYNGGVLIPAKTNSALSWTDLVGTNAGTYTCIVTNYGGSVTSSPAVLTVSNLTTSVSIYQAAVLA